AELATTLKNRPGVVEHGLFLGMATEAIVATETGVQIMDQSS
ncbi:MAG: ribose 5-phosphate isomerase A, partial [Anaerolineae bacterium]|nr:ribose 5-phosphate isomerase A [Anaerolineae bacterium]